MILTLLASFALPFIFWLMFLAIMLSGGRYEMDWGQHSGTFFSMYVVYRRISNTVFYVSLIMSVLMAYVFRQEPAGILALAAIYAFLSDLWMAYCYESYSHSKYPKNPPVDLSRTGSYIGPSSYTSVKYAVTMALSTSAVLLFVFGILWAVNVIVNR